MQKGGNKPLEVTSKAEPAARGVCKNKRKKRKRRGVEHVSNRARHLPLPPHWVPKDSSRFGFNPVLGKVIICCTHIQIISTFAR